MHLRLASRGVAALAVALLTTYAAGSAYADSIPVVDGDTAAMSTTDIAASGCTLPVQRDGLITVKRNGNVHLTAGADFSLVWSSTDTNVTVERTDTTQKVPATYDQNGQDSFQVGIRTTIKASAASTGQSTVSVKVTQPGYTSMTAASYAVSWSCTTNTAPVVTIGGVSAGASYEYGSVPAATCSWTDDHDGSGTVLPTVTGPNGKLGTQTVSCSKTDSAGLVGSATASYSIVDTTGPAFSTVADVSTSAVDASGAPVTYTAPSATDAVDGDRPVTCAPASGSTFPLGSSTVTCSATDLNGNTGSTTFAVKVADTAAPVVTVPKDDTVAATSPAGAAYSYAATAKDNVDGDVAPSCSPASGSTFAFGATTVTCSAIDKAGNKGTASFVVTVQDKTAPVVTVPEPKSVEATGPNGAVVTWDAATATDDTDGTRPVTCDHASGGTYPLGSTTVTCSADDTHGNTGTATFAVVVTDTTPPALTLPDDITAEASSPNGAVVSWKASAKDLVDGAVDVTCDPASGTQFALDTPATVTCTATDAHKNTASDTFTVTVKDTTAPSLPSFKDVTAEATGPQGAAVEYSVDPATDLVDGEVALTCSPASGSTFKLGKSTVTCTATDAHDNTATGIFTVAVEDTTPPVFDPISVPTAEATGPDGAAVTFAAPHATDLVDATPAIQCDHASGSTFPLGATQVTCTATDFSGNKAAQTFTVNVADTTAPVVSTPPSQTIEATSAAGAAYTWVDPIATDLVDGNRPVSCDHEQGSTFPLGKTVVTCSATDLSGNEGTSAFTVTVRDTTAPAFGSAPNLTAVATSASGAKVTYTNPVATDLVDGQTAVTCDVPSGSTFPLGTTTVTCTTQDKAGNPNAITFTVTVTVAWSGFLAPVVDKGVYKQGSTIPVKFALTGASAAVTNLQATLWLRKLPSTDGAKDPVVVSTSAATTGNLFRYTDGQYLFNLNTKPLAVGSYELRVDLGDGVARTVTISLR